MSKKLTTACLALVALAAFVLPAAAQAANTPILTAPTGTTLAAGQFFEGSNAAGSVALLTDTAGNSNLSCTSIRMTGKLTSNVTGNVQANITSATFTGTGSGGACTGIFNSKYTMEKLPWCLKSTEANGENEFTISGGECGKAPTKINFSISVSGNESQKCTYESTGTTSIRGTFTPDTTTQDAVLTTPRTGHTANEDSGFTKVTDDVIFNPCPSSSSLDMSLTLQTDEATPKPIFITK